MPHFFRASCTLEFPPEDASITYLSADSFREKGCFAAAAFAFDADGDPSIVVTDAIFALPIQCAVTREGSHSFAVVATGAVLGDTELGSQFRDMVALGARLSHRAGIPITAHVNVDEGESGPGAPRYCGISSLNLIFDGLLTPNGLSQGCVTLLTEEEAFSPL